jgi:hypothetical protein
MNDPVIEAAIRAAGSLLIRRESITVAREALKPIRGWFERMALEDDSPTKQDWADLAKLIYTSEELKQ